MNFAGFAAIFWPLIILTSFELVEVRYLLVCTPLIYILAIDKSKSKLSMVNFLLDLRDIKLENRGVSVLFSGLLIQKATLVTECLDQLFFNEVPPLVTFEDFHEFLFDFQFVLFIELRKDGAATYDSAVLKMCWLPVGSLIIKSIPPYPESSNFLGDCNLDAILLVVVPVLILGMIF